MHDMTGLEWTALGVLVTFVIGGIGIFFGIPTWRLARHALAQQEAQAAQARLQEQVLNVLGGEGANQPRSSDNPSVLDALKDLRGALSDIAELQAVTGWHMSDGHGPDMGRIFREGFPRVGPGRGPHPPSRSAG